MNKADYVDAVARKSGLSKKDAELALDTFVEVLTEALQKNERVQVSGLGVFEAKQRPEREGRNPQTGATIKIKAQNAVSFSVSKTLKEAINN